MHEHEARIVQCYLYLHALTNACDSTNERLLILPPPHPPLSSFDHPSSTITYPSHLYLSDIPLPTLIAPTITTPLLLDERDVDQDDDVVYLTTRTTLHATPSMPHASLHPLTHSIPNFDLCAKFPP